MATTLPVSKATPRRHKKSKAAQFVSLDGRIRVEDWAKLPETKPHYELIDGVLKQKMPTRREHSNVAAELLFFLMSWGRSLGWKFFPEGTGLKVDGFDGFVPDVTGFAPGTQFEPKAVYDGPPFLAVEILSPSTAKDDRNKKMKGYARAEVEIYLLIDPDKKTLEVYRLQDEHFGAPEILKDADIWQPAELPGLRLELSKLWM